MRKGPRILALEGASRPKGTSPALSDGPAAAGCSAEGYILYRGPKVPPATNQSPRPSTAKRLFSCLSWPASKDQRQSKRKSRDCWWGPRRKTPAVGMPPPRGHLSPKQGSTLLPPWWRKGPATTAQSVDPTELAVFLRALCLKMGVLYCIIKGKARLGCLGHHRLYTVNSEDKGAPAQLAEALLPAATTDVMRSATTGEATSWVQSWRRKLLNWKRLRLKNWPPN